MWHFFTKSAESQMPGPVKRCSSTDGSEELLSLLLSPPWRKGLTLCRVPSERSRKLVFHTRLSSRWWLRGHAGPARGRREPWAPLPHPAPLGGPTWLVNVKVSSGDFTLGAEIWGPCFEPLFIQSYSLRPPIPSPRPRPSVQTPAVLSVAYPVGI